MPSAASVKVEKPSSNVSVNNVAAIATAQTDNVDNNSPIRQALVIIEHKIRNLEKRKSKLESYRDNEKNGKELTADQKIAVSKYDEVAMTLEFAREFSKQIVQIVSAAEKDQKKKQKKDESSKKQSELSKIREVLMLQDILHQLRDDDVRQDFLEGNNGAFKVDEQQLALLDIFYAKVVPQRARESGGVPFKTAAQKAADHLSNAIDGKQKEFETSTYAEIKVLLKNIQKCAYFDKDSATAINDVNAAGTDSVNANECKASNEMVNETEFVQDVATDMDNEGKPITDQSEMYAENTETFEFHEAPDAAAVPVPTFPSQAVANSPNGTPPIQSLPPIVPQPAAAHLIEAANQQIGPAAVLPIQTQVPAAAHQLHAAHVQPTTVHAVEQAYFKQHQYIQQMRPLAEVLGAGNFFFLQDSELDSTDLNALANNAQQSVLSQQQQQQQQQITSHTFTNQTFPNVGYVNIKPQVDIQPNQHQQHSHIPGFATQNAPIPIPIVQSAAIAVASPLATTNPQSVNPIIVQQQPIIKPGMPTFTDAQFIPNVLSQIASNINANASIALKSDTTNDQRISDISEWKPDDATAQPTAATKSSSSTASSTSSAANINSNSHHHGGKLKETESTNGNNSDSNAWRDAYSKNSKESNEWNNEMQNDNGPDESNNWSNSAAAPNQRFQFRQNSAGFGRNNRTNGRNHGMSGGGGYRGRNAAYQSNNGNGSNGNRNNNGENNGATNSNTFYRNIDTYYPNGGNRIDKNDNFNRSNGNNYRSRGDNNTATYRSLPQRNPNQNNSSRLNNNNENTDRSHTSINNQSQRLSGNNGHPGGVGGPGGNGSNSTAGNSSRNVNNSTKHNSNYGANRNGGVSNTSRSQIAHDTSVDINA